MTDVYLEEGQVCPSCNEGHLKGTDKCQCSTCGHPPCAFCEGGHMECDKCGDEFLDNKIYHKPDYNDY